MPKRKDSKPGYAKILDAWSAPEDAGAPVGCVATSFTFSPVFFEEECLSRFLRLETDPAEDGPLYLVEREEKLSQVACAAALVDQHHCQGPRSLRWDLLSARLPGGILHAKVSLLHWQNLVRLIVASANLTEDGYRRNLEVFGVLDYRRDGESNAPAECLRVAIDFLHDAATYSTSDTDNPGPAVARWNDFLTRVREIAGGWGSSSPGRGGDAVRAEAVLTGPGRPSALESLRKAWAGHGPPEWASVVSPFFDPPDAPNEPTKELWNLVKQRGHAEVAFGVTAEEVPGQKVLLLHAPESLKDAHPPGRRKAETVFFQVGLDATRPLHAKCIWLESESRLAYMIGSSNFTSAGLGLTKAPNLEANLVYLARTGGRAYRAMEQRHPEWQPFDADQEFRWQAAPGTGEDDASPQAILLPPAFAEAIYRNEESVGECIDLSFAAEPPAGWALFADEGASVFYDEAAWRAQGGPRHVAVPWAAARPPSGLKVRWDDSGGSAWWPVNVASAASLPPPDELRDLPLEVLIDILTSARPLHQAMRAWIKRRQERGDGQGTVELDPHKRVDTSTFLLQRTRRVSWALTALRERLKRPAATRASLEWRLRGPVGVMALSRALLKEAKSEQEKSFLLAELALELSRVKPQRAPGCLKPDEVLAEMRKVIEELNAAVSFDSLALLPDLQAYVSHAFQRALT